jgi:hypothetical protein
MKPRSIAIFGSVLVIVGSILPWARWTGPLHLSHSFSGFAGIGKIACAAGVVAILAVFLASRMPGKLANVLAGLFGVGSGIPAVWSLMNPDWARALLPSVTMQTNIGGQITVADTSIGSVSTGFGVFVVLAGALLLIAGGMLYKPESEA